MKKLVKKYPLFCIIWGILPALMGVLAYSIFFHSIPTDMPIGVIDDDNSSTSKELIFMVESSPALSIVKYYHSINEAKEDLSRADIYGLVVIPKDFQLHIKRGLGSSVGFYYNTQFVLIGKSLNSAFLQIMAMFNAKATIASNIAKDSNMLLAKARSLPIIPKIQALFNPKNDYAQFLLTVMLPCMWQILVAVGMLNLIDKMPSSIKSLLIKLALNVGCAMFWGIAMLTIFTYLGYPSEGSISIIILGLFIFALAMSGLVICFQSILKESIKSISVIGAYCAPSLAFAGVTYPQNSMEIFASFWNQILPISYFMSLYLQQANYGIDVSYSLSIIMDMLPFLLFLLLGIAIYNMRMGKINTKHSL